MERTSHAGSEATREPTSCEETDTTNAKKSGRVYIFEWKRKCDNNQEPSRMSEKMKRSL